METQNEARARVLAKIRKCLALAESSNANEAAVALKQAHALMAREGITEAEMLAAEVNEVEIASRNPRKPPAWECTLVAEISRAFGVVEIFSPGAAKPRTETDGKQRHRVGKWKFLGTGAAPTVAAYAYRVCMRLVSAARSDFAYSIFYEPDTVVLEAREKIDAFCLGWVLKVAVHLRDFAAPFRNDAAINAYMERNYGKLDELETKNVDPELHEDAFSRGVHAAKDVRLQVPVEAAKQAAGIGETRRLR